jgi:mandelamide amidase
VLTGLSLIEAAERLHSGALSAAAYAEALVARRGEWASINAIVHQDCEALREAARAADQSRLRGDSPGPLHGIPLLIKDNMHTSGVPTTSCTPALRDFVPEQDAPVVARLKAAGALIFGKANMHELALGITSSPSAFGPVHNPYDQRLIAGGSSGGTAAAIAAGIVPAGLGSDTGGSIRIPASLCGICGLRPTVGRYPTDGVMPISFTRDVVGPMARSVVDLALLDAVLRDEPADELALIKLRDLRLGVPQRYFFADLEPGVAQVVERALDRLVEAGVRLVDAEIPDIAELNAAIATPVLVHELQSAIPAYLAAYLPGLSLAEFVSSIGSADVRRFFELDEERQAEFARAYREAIDVHRPALQASIRNYFTAHRLHACLVPATPITARPIGEEREVELDGRRVPTTATYTRNVAPASTSGNPSLALPAGITATGLPVGLLLDGLAGRDRELLAIGAALERVLEPVARP